MKENPALRVPRDPRDLPPLRRLDLARRRPTRRSIADASDAAQFAELKTLGELTLRAWERACR